MTRTIANSFIREKEGGGVSGLRLLLLLVVVVVVGFSPSSFVAIAVLGAPSS